MTAPVAVNPKVEVSKSCNNWFCCAPKKSTSKEMEQAAKKAVQVAEKFRRGSHQTEYTIDYDTVHVRVQSHVE